MDKYETKLRLEEIDRLRKQKKYKKAARLADTIEWNRIRNVETLRNAADIYKECQEYKKSKELLEFAYERSPYSKSVLFALCEISLLCNEDQEATDYYREYCNVVPEGDSGIYILRFKMTRKFGGGLAEQIGILEELKERDRQEVWLYVLAVLYEQAGQIEKCVELCDELSLWFGEGSYVYKALELKMKYENLTPEQQSIYSRKEIERARREEERAKKEAHAISNTGRMPGKERRKTGKLPGANDVEDEVRRRRRNDERASREEDKEEDYHVKTINLNKYNTMDLQKELAEDLQKYVNDEPSVINRMDLNEAENNNESAEIPGAYTEEKLSATEQFAPTQVIQDTQSVDSEEVFFEDSTEDLHYTLEVPKAPTENKRLQEFKEQYSREMKGKVLPEGFGRLSEEGTTSQEALSFTGGIVEEKVLGDGTVELIKHFEEDAEPEVVKVSKDRRTGQTGPISTGAIRKRPVSEEKRETRPIRLKSDDPDYVDMLPPTEERQVSGQLNIQDILAGWELQKKQMEEARKENFRKKTLENTGNMFADFDKEANSGLLATLENPALINSVTEQSTPDDFLKGVSVEDVKNGKKPTYLRKSDMAALEEGLKAGAVSEPEEEEPDEIIFAELGDTTVKAEPLKFGMVQPAEEAKSEEEIAEVKEVFEESGENANEDDVIPEDVAAAALEENVTEAEAAGTTAEDVTEDGTAGVVEEDIAAEDIAEENAGLAEEPAQSGKEKSLYFGSVTEQISGNIWDEVDNVVPTPVAETAGAVEDDETATRMISRESVEESLSEEYTETEEPAAEEFAEEPAEESVEEITGEEVSKEPAEEIPAQEVLPAETGAQEASLEEENTVTEEDTVTEEEEESEGEGDDQQNLIKELKKYFDIYMYSKKMKAQIMDAAENASLAAYCGNLIVTSDSPESAEQFARAFSRYLRNSDPNFTGKPARISAQAVNEKDVNEIFEKATNSCVVISRAGRLTNNSVNKILSCLNQEARGVEVILYDSKNEIRKLLERGPVLERFFNCRVDIVALSTEMLAEYGRKFALDQGYSIDDMAMLAFSERISELQVGTHEVTINEVKEIVDDATEHVNKPGPEKLFRTMNGTRYDENHRVILREKDFWYRGNREDKEKDEDENEPGKKEKKNKK